MTRVFTWQFDVRGYELDSFGHVNNAVYNNYMEEAASRASADAGFSRAWYFEHHRAWVIRRLTVQYLASLTYGDQVEMKTWVSDFHRTYSHREYELRRLADDRPVLRGRARWAYVDLDTIRPARLPAEFEAAFDPSGQLEDFDIHLKRATVFEDNPAFVSARRVQRYELDGAGHVNNSVYLNWFEQAMFDAMARAGWPVARLAEHGIGMVQVAHEVDYLMPALDGTALEIHSRPVEMAHVRGAWTHEIRSADTGDVVARDYSVGAFLDLKTGRPVALPDVVIQDLLAGERA